MIALANESSTVQDVVAGDWAGWVFDTAARHALARPAQDSVASPAKTGDEPSSTGDEETRAEVLIVAGVHYVSGEPFLIEYEDGYVFLRHDRWSLMGSGETVIAAELDLVSEAEDIVPALDRVRVSSLSADAFDMRNFAMRIVSRGARSR